MIKQTSDEHIDKKYSSIINYLSNILCKDVAVTIGEYIYYCKGKQNIMKKFNSSIDSVLLISLKSQSSQHTQMLVGQDETNNKKMFWWSLHTPKIKYKDGSDGFANI